MAATHVQSSRPCGRCLPPAAPHIVLGNPERILTSALSTLLTSSPLHHAELGVLPQVTQATASAMVLFSSSSAAASFAIDDRLPLPYAASFGTACAVAAYVGVALVSRAVKKSGRASLVAWLLTGIVGAGAGLTLVYSGSDALAGLLAGGGGGGTGLCGPL